MYGPSRNRLLRQRRSNKGVSEVSQFISVVYILFLITFLPLLNLGTLFVAAATQYLATNEFVSKASTQPDYSSALNMMVNEAYQFQTMGLAKFLNMIPEGGYTGCGDDLYVVTTDIASGAVTQSAANEPLTQAVNTGSKMYELSIKSVYSFAPLISLASVPVLGSVPGLGRPVTLSFSASRPVEHPSGLQNAANSGGQSSSIAVTPFPRLSGSDAEPDTASADSWRNPTIYQMIAAAGQTVLIDNVVLVEATNSQWTPTSVTVNPGDIVWIDTQAVGTWTTGPPANLPLDANGGGNLSEAGTVMPTAPWAALLGRMGTAGTPFFLGNQQFNYPPPGTGTLELICNDDYWIDNQGSQMVRIIVTH